jgi:hypothetical protein
LTNVCSSNDNNHKDDVLKDNKYHYFILLDKKGSEKLREEE